MKEYTVYCHTLFDGRKYIGATSQPLSRRWRADGLGYKGSRFYKAILQYGWKSFEHEIIKTNLTKEEAYDLEISLIQKYKTQYPEHGFNEQGGGASWNNPTEKQKKRFSNWSKKVNTGRRCSNETKKKISESRKGERNPNAHGKLMTVERIKKFIEYAKKPKTELQKLHMSQSSKKCPVICVETGQIYKSMKEASEINKIAYSTLSSAVYRGTKAHGFHWKKQEELQEI